MLRTLALAALLVTPTLLWSETPKGVESSDLNRQANACGDFYEFANGSWRGANPIPLGKSRWSRRIASHDSNWLREQAILDELSRRRDWPQRSIEKLLGDHYAACMDVTRVEAAGFTPLLPLLTEIDAIKTAGEVQRVIRHLHQLAVFVPFGVAAATDYQQPQRTIATVTAAGLGLPDRDYYLASTPHAVEVRTNYQTHVARTLALSGLGTWQAAQAARAIVALEMSLATESFDSATALDPAATDHKFSFAQLQALTPHVDWDDYMNEARLPHAELNVAEPRFMQRVDEELHTAPLQTWKAYFRWQLLNSAAPWLSTDFARESLSFGEKYLGAAGGRPRAQHCVESTEALFGDALGRKYAERYFSPADKAKAEAVVRNLRAVLHDAAAATPWMTKATKALMLKKLAATEVFVGYPNTWKDYAVVRVRRDGFWDNVAAGRRFGVEENRAHVGKPTDSSLWALSAASPDAYLDLQLNVIVIPAGALQPPFFTADGSDAVNYGSFGIQLAHDLTHFADESLGSSSDLEGRPRPWWTPNDRQEWEDRAQCLVDQFDGYFIEPNVHHDGKRVSSESIADLAGVRIAYLALLKSMQTHPVPSIEGFTPEQQFFIAWGQTSGTAMTLEAQRQLVRGDVHPVGKYRVIGPLSNSPEFARAFACKPGDTMIRAPEKTCKVW